MGYSPFLLRIARRELVASVVLFVASDSLWAQAPTTFADHVLPLVEQHCAKCHNADKKKGDLDLSSHSGVLKGGGTGPVVVPGNPDSSKLIKVLAHVEEPTMPPNKPPLPEKELAVFKKWIAGGLLETSGSKAVAAAKPKVDLTLKVSDAGRPDGPPPMPKELSLEPVVHTKRAAAVGGLAASPWAPLIAVAGQKQVLLFNSTNQALLGVLPFGGGQPLDVRFSRSGKVLVVAGGHGAKAGSATLWNVETGEPIATLGKEYDAVLTADLSADQSRVALGGTDRLVKIYSTKSGELEHKIKKHTDWVTTVAFSPNGEMLASGDRNGGVTVWDVESGQELFTTAGHKSAVTSLSWRSDSKLVASSSEDGNVTLWESSEGKQAKTWAAHKGGTLCVEYSRDGRFVTCGRDGAVTTWNASGARQKSMTVEGEMALRCAWVDDGATVVAGDFAGNVWLWDAQTGRELGALETNPRPLSERIAALKDQIAELRTVGDKTSPALLEAEKSIAEARAALAAANVEAGQVQATFAAEAKEVVRLKALAAMPNPSSEIGPQLAAARAAREKTRAKRTAATDLVGELSGRADAASRRLERLKSESDREAALRRAEAELVRLIQAKDFEERKGRQQRAKL